MTRSSVVCVLFLVAGSGCAAQATEALPTSPGAEAYLAAVKVYADKVIEHGRDTYGPKKTPLFVDGLNVDTLGPPIYKRHGRQWVMSNQASQQNLFRTLDSLTMLTGDARYRRAATEAIAYAFKNLRERHGLLWWGGHRAYDAAGEHRVSENEQHELKYHMPYYELMWQVDKDATKRFIECFWAGHIYDWATLNMNRHGRDKDPAGVWDHKYKGGKVPFDGALSFLNTGTDLIYSAGLLCHFTGDDKPLVWAKRLARRYVDVQHPKTGLGGYQYTLTKRRRVAVQFPQYKGELNEATAISVGGSGRFDRSAVVKLYLSELLGDKGADFRTWAIHDLRAYAKYGYDSKTNLMYALHYNGTRLKPGDIKKPGYFSPRRLTPRKPGDLHLYGYAMGYRFSRDPALWEVARGIGRGLDLGDLGVEPGKECKLNLKTACSSPVVILALLDIHKAAANKAYLLLARRIADNALKGRVHNGFFVPSKNHLFTHFNDATPLALLHLYNALRDPSAAKKLPAYVGGGAYFHCPYDGKGRTYDRNVIYSRLRK